LRERPKLEDTTFGWRFVNPALKARFGVDSMPETAENVAKEPTIARADQDAFALRSQQRAAAAHAAGRFAEEIAPVPVSRSKGEVVFVQEDKQLRPQTTRTARLAEERYRRLELAGPAHALPPAMVVAAQGAPPMPPCSLAPGRSDRQDRASLSA
jgi:acetyl-CoA acetyltransferase